MTQEESNNKVDNGKSSGSGNNSGGDTVVCGVTNANGTMEKIMAVALPDSQKSVVLNVGGQKYETLTKNFGNFPNSRLYRAVHSNTPDEILRYCDRYKAGFENGNTNDYVPAEYFFDRNWTGFAAILDTYRTGNLHLNANICAVMTRDDMEYWGIDVLLVEPCCAVKYYPEIEICVKEIEMEENEKRIEIEREKIEDFGPTLQGRIRKYLWNLFEYPSTSKGAQFIALFSLSMVIISTACFVLSTTPEFQGAVGGIGLDDHHMTTTIKPEGGNETIVDDHHVSVAIDVIVWIDAFTAVFFTIEYVVRFACSPRKLRFFVNPMNLVDLFAILPYFVSFLIDHLSEFHIIGKTGKVLRLIRVTRILRVFKLVRHFAGLQSLFCTLKQAHKELGLLVMLITVAVLTFSSLVYFAEKEEQNWSYVDSFWWGLLTITTVGYGNITPHSGMGRLIGGFCAVFGAFTIVLPVPIIVNSFSNFYRNRLWRGEVAMKRRERLIHVSANKVNLE